MRQGKFSLKLTPQLTFAKIIDGKIGEAGVEIPYPYALPVVQAYGQGQNKVEWRFLHQSDFPLIGDLTTFLVADAPNDSDGFLIELQLHATLETRFGPIPLWTTQIPPQKIARAIR